ncbi:hypothetical protein N7454_004203 [Penicillium verhagenii]|nr:hypothetical protein N7454_004203 [Penicillium verhagenii]
MAIIAQCDKLLAVVVLQRSSHIVSVFDKQAFIFGGELLPCVPRDIDAHVHTLVADASIKTYPATSDSPSARVGTASAALNGNIYLFSGRGGTAMTPIEENGTIWEYDPSKTSWSLIEPSKKSPETSYHYMTSDGKDTLYLHAGCPEKGRVGDLRVFHISRKEWTKLAPSFDLPCGGTWIAFVDDKLYRMSEFDGKTDIWNRVGT